MPNALTAADRCDRCGARAAHRHEFTAGELLFCEHHNREHADKIRALTTTTPRLG